MSDAIERLRNRTRATVPSRDASLLKTKGEEVANSANTEFKNDSMTEISHSLISQVSKDALPLPEPQENAEPEVVRRTVRIENAIDEKLEQLCRREKVTRDVFLEAAYLTCSNNPSLLQQVLDVAKSRYQKRKAAGEQRKFRTMEKKYRSGEVE